MAKTSNFLFIFVSFTFIYITSCSEGEVYFKYHRIDRGMWYRDSVLSLSMDSVSFNPAGRYDLTIELTTADIYLYKDIWLNVEQNLEDSLFQNDTLHVQLADEHDGKWLGGGIGGLNQLTVPYKSAEILDTIWVYELRITHLMNDNPLQGVEKVGLKVVEY